MYTTYSGLKISKQIACTQFEVCIKQGNRDMDGEFWGSHAHQIGNKSPSCDMHNYVPM